MSNEFMNLFIGKADSVIQRVYKVTEPDS